MPKKFRLPVPRFTKYNPIDNDEVNTQFQSIPNYLNSGVSGSNLQEGIVTAAKCNSGIADGVTLTFDTELSLKGNIGREHLEDFLVNQNTTKWGRIISRPVYFEATSLATISSLVVPSGRNYYLLGIPNEESELTLGVQPPFNVSYEPDEDAVTVDHSCFELAGFSGDIDYGITFRAQITDGSTTVQKTYIYRVESSENSVNSSAKLPPSIFKCFLDTSTLDQDKETYQVNIAIGGNTLGGATQPLTGNKVTAKNILFVAIPL